MDVKYWTGNTLPTTCGRVSEQTGSGFQNSVRINLINIIAVVALVLVRTCVPGRVIRSISTNQFNPTDL